MVIFTDNLYKYYINQSQHFSLEKLYPIRGFSIIITTRSKLKLIAIKVGDYFESLIKPLIINRSLEKFVGAFQEKNVNNFEKKLDKQNSKVIQLETKIVIQDNAFQKLEIKCDDNKQYGRRLCVRYVYE